MREALSTFDAGLKKNPYVRIGPKGGGWITLTPLDAQPEPPNLTALKAELNTIWPMTSLLDMVKETDLRLGFTGALKSPALSTWSSLRKKLGGRNMLPILIRSPLRGLFLGTARLLLIFRQGHR